MTAFTSGGFGKYSLPRAAPRSRFVAAAFLRTSDNKVTELHADIGGFLGIGEHRVRLAPAQFSLHSDRVVLELTAAQSKELLKIQK